MQSTNLLKKHINISIFSRTLSEDIFQDVRFVQLMNILLQTKNKHRYSYCFYCDQYVLKTNIFIPIFHTMYLACENNNVLIKNSEDLWIVDTFKNNNYFVLENREDMFDYEKSGVKKIKNIKDIEGLI
jgi:hypothetical protein